MIDLINECMELALPDYKREGNVFIKRKSIRYAVASQDNMGLKLAFVEHNSGKNTVYEILPKHADKVPDWIKQTLKEIKTKTLGTSFACLGSLYDIHK